MLLKYFQIWERLFVTVTPPNCGPPCARPAYITTCLYIQSIGKMQNVCRYNQIFSGSPLPEPNNRLCNAMKMDLSVLMQVMRGRFVGTKRWRMPVARRENQRVLTRAINPPALQILAIEINTGKEIGRRKSLCKSYGSLSMPSVNQGSTAHGVVSSPVSFHRDIFCARIGGKYQCFTFIEILYLTKVQIKDLHSTAHGVASGPTFWCLFYHYRFLRLMLARTHWKNILFSSL